MKKVEIKLSKFKIFFLFLGSLIFVLAGIFLLSTQKTSIKYDPVFIKIVGIVTITFFGAVAIFCLKKLFAKSVGLIVDENGVFDSFSIYNFGLIKWSDVVSIETKKISSVTFLLIHVKNPEFYIKKTKWLKKMLANSNYSAHKTPLFISSGSLSISFNELEELITTSFERYRSKSLYI